jgi:hypothetical protein
VKCRLARLARQVSVDGDAGHPGQPVAGEDERPGVSLFARDARVHEDVLQLSAATPTHRPHPQAGPPKLQPECEALLQMHAVTADASILAVALRNLELRASLARLVIVGRDDLHGVTDHAEAESARQVDASPSGARLGESQHCRQMSAR